MALKSGRDRDLGRIPLAANRRKVMTIKQRLYASIAALGTVGLLVSAPAQLCAQTAAAIDNDDIGGVVTGPNGPEGGSG